MPALREVHEAIKNKRSKLIAINLTDNDSMKDVLAFVKEGAVTYPVLLDEKGSVGNAYGIRSIPTVIIIDQKGLVVEHRVGGMEKEEMLRLLEDN